MCTCCRGAVCACLDECGFGPSDGFGANEFHDRRRRSCCLGAAMAYGSVFVCMQLATTCLLTAALCVYVFAVYGPAAWQMAQ